MAEGSANLITDANLRDLDIKGYTVVTGVVPPDECDAAIRHYRDWLRQFGNGFPRSFYSIISGFNTGHMDITWKLRLQTKPVFAQLWKTEKLLTSVDAISIGRPPEGGEVAFQEPDKYWLHADQTYERIGLHAYQGALYLEEQCDDDWTFQVMEGSHNRLDEFYTSHASTKRPGRIKNGYLRLSQNEKKEFIKAGCRITRVPVPKGGMVLWDSRLIHANARPLQNRKNPGRWRYVVFVCMGPAVWASDKDLEERREVCDKAMMTNHWPVQCTKSFASQCPGKYSCPDRIPEFVRTDEGRRLIGDLQYDFNDGQPNGPDFVPRWYEDKDIGPRRKRAK